MSIMVRKFGYFSRPYRQGADRSYFRADHRTMDDALLILAALVFALAFLALRMYLLARKLRWAAAHPDQVDMTELRKAQAALHAVKEEPHRQIAAAKAGLGDYRKDWRQTRKAPARHLRAARAILGRRTRTSRTMRPQP